jgi:dTMP kinase
MDFKQLAGQFIVLDGPDGAGKSTQVQLLADAMGKQGVGCITVRDPGGTTIGDQIREILLSNQNAAMNSACEALLYMASRAQLWSEVIGPVLAAGKCVIADRWVSSTIAYQAVAGRLGTDEVIRIAEASLERVWADLTVIIDLPSERGLERVSEADRMENKGQKYHRQVRQAFVDLANEREDFLVVDASGTIDQVHQRICEVMKTHVAT